jgi:hypothetical protein
MSKAVGVHPAPPLEVLKTLSTADSLRHHCKLGGAPPRSPAPVSTGGRRGVGKSSDGHDEHSRIVLPPETGEQPSLSSGLSDAPWLNRRPGFKSVYPCSLASLFPLPGPCLLAFRVLFRFELSNSAQKRISHCVLVRTAVIQSECLSTP